jgi:hypothetical protein
LINLINLLLLKLYLISILSISLVLFIFRYIQELQRSNCPDIAFTKIFCFCISVFISMLHYYVTDVFGSCFRKFDLFSLAFFIFYIIIILLYSNFFSKKRSKIVTSKSVGNNFINKNAGFSFMGLETFSSIVRYLNLDFRKLVNGRLSDGIMVFLLKLARCKCHFQFFDKIKFFVYYLL